MFISFLYIILSILGLSFLIFIHELGHYFMARRVGMRVEIFSIGFGTPIYSWELHGVKWQIGWLLFGGYVKIAGTDIEKDKNPYEVSDGFFGKSPLDRIKVALMGPVANLLFALLAFSALWVMGGREEFYSDFTSKIGWVDPESALFKYGVRPGDEIVGYDDQAYQGAKDHIYIPMTTKEPLLVKGYKVNYERTPVEKIPFEYSVDAYQHPAAIDNRLTSGITQTANYLIYDRFQGQKENSLLEGSAMENSGLQYGDRIVWANGERVFSAQHLDHILNSNNALLTVQNGPHTRFARVQRVQVQELRPDPLFREELMDWQFEAGLNNVKLQHIYTIPYLLTNDCVVEKELRFIEKEKELEAFPVHRYSTVDAPLQPGDRVIAINGTPIAHCYDLLQKLQTLSVNIIVQRNPRAIQKISWKDADAQYDQSVDTVTLQNIVNSIGTNQPITHEKDLYLLNPITPKMRSELALSPERQAILIAELKEQRKAIESIEDPERRSQIMRLFEKKEKRLLLGIPLQDRRVNYNPEPLTLFQNVAQEIWRTLTALITGSLNPKWIVGPIGIVQVVHSTSMSSLKEAFYWLGAISLNLGILNLLPIPVLDGGTILMSLVEIVTKRRMHPKTLEKLILPFAVLIICFFIYLTYNDLSRIFSGFFK